MRTRLISAAHRAWLSVHAEKIDRAFLYLGVSAALFGGYQAAQTANDAKGASAEAVAAAKHTAIVAARQARQAHKALCNVHADYQHRLEQSRAFFAANPDGAFGYSPAQIRQQIEFQRQTVESLADLRCR